jgi:hypothetical protein
MGFRWRNLFPAFEAIYRRFCRRHLVRWRCHHERLGAVHVEREPMGERLELHPSVVTDHAELGIEDGILLHRSRSSLCHWRLVHHSRAGWVSEMLAVSEYS